MTARSTKNYELDRAVRHTKGAMGTITKIGVGVLINERPLPPGAKVEKNPDGSTPTSVPYTPEEIERLNQLVKGAVGFNNERGDVVTVVGTKFEPQYDPTVIPWWRDENYQVMVNAGVVGGIFLLILLTVVRPMVRRLLAPEIDPKALAAAAADAATTQAQMAIDVATAENAAAQAAAAYAKKTHDGEMIRVDGQVNALVTPDHQFWMKNKKGQYKRFRAGNLPKSTQWLIPRTGIWTGKYIPELIIPKLDVFVNERITNKGEWTKEKTGKEVSRREPQKKLMKTFNKLTNNGKDQTKYQLKEVKNEWVS